MNLMQNFEIENNTKNEQEFLTNEEFESSVLEILSNFDGEDIKCFENEINPEVCRRVIIVSFVSNRQIIGVINKVVRYAKSNNKMAKCPTRKKNIDTEWTAIDCGDLMIHLFKKEVREYYNLDRFFAEGY